jgi:hypothetical protein
MTILYGVILSFLLIVVSSSRIDDGVTVFEAYVGYPPCYRQPVLVTAAGNTLLAFAGILLVIYRSI